MAVVAVNNHPLLTVTDELVIIHQNYENRARVYVRSLTTSAEFSLQSGLALETLGTAVNTTLSGLGVVTDVSIPIGGVTTERVTKLAVVSGQVEVSIVSPSEFRSYLTVQQG